MFSKRSRTVNITRGLAMAVGAVPLQLKTREKKIAQVALPLYYIYLYISSCMVVKY